MASQMFLKSFLSFAPSTITYNNMTTTRGVLPTASASTSVTNTTNSGTKIQCTATGGGTAIKWISPPLKNPVTISGTITFNIRAKEATIGNNAGITVDVLRFSDLASLISSPKGVELTTTDAAQNWTGSPTSRTFNAGDRIVVIVYVSNVGTMGAGSPGVTITYGAATAAAAGDTYVTFTEDLQFITEPECIQLKYGGASTSVATPANTTAGNLMIFFINCAAGGTTGPPTAPGLTWFGLGVVTNGTNNTQTFYAQNIPGGALTITTNSTITGDSYLFEITGVTNSPFDQKSSATGTSTTPSSGNTPRTNFLWELIIGTFYSAGNATAGTGFALIDNTNGNVVEGKLVLSCGTQAVTDSQTNVGYTAQCSTWRAFYQPSAPNFFHFF